MTARIPISLEFFPPKGEEAAAKLRQARQALYALKPEYCSVTFGAGGSTQEGTLQSVREILAEGFAAAPHLSCIGASAESLRALLKAYQAAGARHIVALRGDLPSGFGMLDGEFEHASDLVAFIRRETGDWFDIKVAGYPEAHPQSRSLADDLRFFALKMRAGANSAVTQFFYNADAYFRLRDDAAKLGVTAPIVPGIMPIINATQLQRFAAACGAEIPRWLALRLNELGEDKEALREFGQDAVANLCRRLIDGGAPALHFYTMNQSRATLGIVERI